MTSMSAHGGADAFVELFATGFTAVVLHVVTVLVGAMLVFDDGGTLAVGTGWICGDGHGSQGVSMSMFYTSSFLRPAPQSPITQSW